MKDRYGATATATIPEPEAGLTGLLRDTFRLREGGTAKILEKLLRAARLHMGLEVAFISEFTEDRRVFRYVDEGEGVSLLKVGQSDPLDESYCKWVVEGRLPQLIQDAQTVEEALELEATRQLGIGAHVSVPIRLSDGSVFGTFCSFSFHAAHDLNERDLALMRVFADIAAGLVEQDVQRARREQSIRARLQQVLDRDNLRIVWQPIVDVTDNRIIGLESLARFPTNQERGPAVWFDEAAEVGLAESLENRAVEHALKVLEHLPDGYFVTFNISGRALLQGGLVQLLQEMPLERLVLEITEHDVIDDYAQLTEVLAPLREQGLRLAVDDAGAGYATFRHILYLRPHLIKLDMSLVRDIDSDIARRSLAASLVWFANDIGATLVAEGVETESELAVLRNLGVHTVQGFYLHKPMDLDHLLPLLQHSG